MCLKKEKKRVVQKVSSDEHTDDGNMTTVKMRFNTSLKKDDYLRPFKKEFMERVNFIAQNMSLIHYLASHLLNFHLARLLQNDIELPTFNQTFFGRCCIIVTDTTRKNADEELGISFHEFKSLHDNYKAPRNAYTGSFMSSLARQMMTNFHNGIWMNMESRIIRYVRFKYSIATK